MIKEDRGCAMSWKRVLSGILASLLLFGLAGCAEEQPQETNANETKTNLIEPIAFLSNANARFKKQEDTYTKVYPKSELDESTGKIIQVDLENEKLQEEMDKQLEAVKNAVADNMICDENCEVRSVPA